MGKYQFFDQFAKNEINFSKEHLLILDFYNFGNDRSFAQVKKKRLLGMQDRLEYFLHN